MSTHFFAVVSLIASLTIHMTSSNAQESGGAIGQNPYVIVLGIAQDGGVPQAGTKVHKGWDDERFKRHAVCLAIVDPSSSQRWMIDCTPDFPEQLYMLDEVAPAEGKPGLDGIFLTHASRPRGPGCPWCSRVRDATDVRVSLQKLPVGPARSL
jgi:pyrroloquinoline quinone biosynthesis protein B